jgi:hypothetical protein
MGNKASTPQAAAAQSILATVRRASGVQHEYQLVDCASFPHLSRRFYADCQQRLERLSFRKIMDMEDVTLRNQSPDPRTFLRIMGHPDLRVNAAIYHAKPKFPWWLLMFLMRLPAKVYEFQSRFSNDFMLETSMAPPGIANTYPPQIVKHFHPGKSVEELFATHQQGAKEIQAAHPEARPLFVDSIGTFRELGRRTFELQLAHLRRTGWVTREYLYKQVGKNKRFADEVYEEIQSILRKEEQEHGQPT